MRKQTQVFTLFTSNAFFSPLDLGWVGFFEFYFFFFVQATNLILNFLNADVRSVSCKWSIYSVSASSAGRNRDVQVMSLLRKSGGRLLLCFSREQSDSGKSGDPWKRLVPLCVPGELVQAEAEGRVGDPRDCVCCREGGAQFIQCETYFFCFHFNCCRRSFLGF